VQRCYVPHLLVIISPIMNNGHGAAFLAPPQGLPDTAPVGTSARFDAFVREQYELLVHFLRPRSRTEEDARDTAQESMARLFHHYRDQPTAEWKPVLYRIAINVANDRLRHAQRRHADQHVPLEDMDIEDEQPDAEEAATRAQQDALLRDAVLALPPRCREVYLLKRVHGMTSAQVARHCGISARMVERHLANALAHLCRKFGQAAPNAFQDEA